MAIIWLLVAVIPVVVDPKPLPALDMGAAFGNSIRVFRKHFGLASFAIDRHLSRPETESIYNLKSILLPFSSPPLPPSLFYLTLTSDSIIFALRTDFSSSTRHDTCWILPLNFVINFAAMEICRKQSPKLLQCSVITIEWLWRGMLGWILLMKCF